MTALPSIPYENPLRSQWDVPTDLEGRVVSGFAGVVSLFPKNEGEEDIAVMDSSHSGYKIYFRKLVGDMTNYLAYGCPKCKKTIIGAPKIEDYDNTVLAAGNAGYKVSCVECKIQLEDNVIVHT